MPNMNSTVFANDDATERYLDAPTENLLIVDLIAANPDVSAMLGSRGGTYDVEVNVVYLEGMKHFEAHVDDAWSGAFEDEVARREVYDNEAEAREAADRMIVEWKINWGIVL